MAEYNREADAITAALFRAQGEAGVAHLYLTDRRAFDRRIERGRQHFFGPPAGAHAAYLRSKGIIERPVIELREALRPVCSPSLPSSSWLRRSYPEILRLPSTGWGCYSQ